MPLIPLDQLVNAITISPGTQPRSSFPVPFNSNGNGLMYCWRVLSIGKQCSLKLQRHLAWIKLTFQRHEHFTVELWHAPGSRLGSTHTVPHVLTVRPKTLKMQRSDKQKKPLRRGVHIHIEELNVDFFYPNKITRCLYSTSSDS
jgi:hypothetical protein